VDDRSPRKVSYWFVNGDVRFTILVGCQRIRQKGLIIIEAVYSEP